MEAEELAKKLIELSNKIDDEMIKNATKEELMSYLFMVEKLKAKIEKAVNIEGEM